MVAVDPFGVQCDMAVGLGLGLRRRDSPHEKYIRAGGGFLSAPFGV